jgi:hypothetical protein
MDKLDRMLRALPSDAVPAELASRIGESVRRRHRRGQLARRAGASLLAVLGLWLVWPGIAWMSSTELFASGAPWLTGGLQYLNYESMDALGRLWNGAISAEGAISSTLAISILVGAAFLCCSIFLAVDPVSWRLVPGRYGAAGDSKILSSGLHP